MTRFVGKDLLLSFEIGDSWEDVLPFLQVHPYRSGLRAREAISLHLVKVPTRYLQRGGRARRETSIVQTPLDRKPGAPCVARFAVSRPFRCAMDIMKRSPSEQTGRAPQGTHAPCAAVASRQCGEGAVWAIPHAKSTRSSIRSS